MATAMLCAYYDREADSRSLFEKCKISKIAEEKRTLEWDEYLGKFDVIRLVMTDFFNDMKVKRYNLSCPSTNKVNRKITSYAKSRSRSLREAIPGTS